jgi:hypothetical protein
MRKRVVLMLGVVMFVLSQASFSQTPTVDPTTSGAPWRTTQLRVESYPDFGELLQQKLKTALAAKPTVDWIVYSSLSCSAEWDEICEGNKLIEAPAGWQACKVLYSVSGSDRGSQYSVTPTNWYTNDPESPDRLRAYNFYLYAKGSGTIFDR